MVSASMGFTVNAPADLHIRAHTNNDSSHDMKPQMVGYNMVVNCDNKAVVMGSRYSSYKFSSLQRHIFNSNCQLNTFQLSTTH